MSMPAGYEKVDYIGQGAFGKVQKVRRLTDGNILACKVIKLRGHTSLEEAENEYRVLRKLQHPNIVHYFDYQCAHIPASSQPTKLRLFMEYCPEGSLQDLIKTNQRDQVSVLENTVWQIISQVASALRYCHYGTRADGFTERHWQPVLHRDIKPANVLVASRVQDSLTVKLADFGLAKVVDPEVPPDSYAGTHLYQPPEITRSNTRGIQWTKACDIFSLGCTIYTLCTYSPPFVYRMEENDKCPDLPSIYSQRLNACTSRCLALHPEDRHDAFALINISEITQESAQSEGSKVNLDMTTLTAQLNSKTILEAESTNDEHKIPRKSLATDSQMSTSPKTEDWHLISDISSAETLQSNRNESGLQITDGLRHDKDVRTTNDLLSLGKKQYREANYISAELTLRQALDVAKEINGLSSEEVADCLFWLGNTQYMRNEDYQAETTLLSAVNIYKKTNGPESKEVADCLCWIGCAQSRRGCSEAATTLQNALNIFKKTSGPNSKVAADCLYWLGNAQYLLNEDRRAETVLRKSLSIYEKLSGPESKEVADCLYWLGCALCRQRKYSDAAIMSQTGARIYGKTAGTESREVGECLYWLGCAQYWQGKFSDANASFTRARDIIVNVSGTENKYVQNCNDFLLDIKEKDSQTSSVSLVNEGRGEPSVVSLVNGTHGETTSAGEVAGKRRERFAGFFGRSKKS